jgi:hypothetical protein
MMPDHLHPFFRKPHITPILIPVKARGMMIYSIGNFFEAAVFFN